MAGDEIDRLSRRPTPVLSPPTDGEKGDPPEAGTAGDDADPDGDGRNGGGASDVNGVAPADAEVAGVLDRLFKSDAAPAPESPGDAGDGPPADGNPGAADPATTDAATDATTPPAGPADPDRLPLWLRPLAWLSAPLDLLPDWARAAAGQIAVLTLLNAAAVLLYIALFRR